MRASPLVSVCLAAACSGGPEGPPGDPPAGPAAPTSATTPGAALTAATGASPVQILAVNLERGLTNANGRLLRALSPARVLVTLQNTSASVQRGSLAGEVVGDLDSTYGLGEENVELQPGETRYARLYWTFNATTSFDLPSPQTVYRPTYGHAVNVGWKDGGTVLAQGHTALAVEQPTSVTPGDQSLSPTDELALRFSGYLNNASFVPITATTFQLTIGGAAVSQLRWATTYRKTDAYALGLAASSSVQPAVLTLPQPYLTLQRAVLVDPAGAGGVSSTPLYHRVRGDDFSFEVPAHSAQASLLFEVRRVEPRHGDGGAGDTRGPVPLGPLVAAGEQTYGPFRSLLRTPAGEPITTPAQWESNAAAVRSRIWSDLEVAPIPSTTALNPIVLGEQHVAEQVTLTGLARAYLRRKISIEIQPGERMSFWLLVPEGLGPYPAVLAFHETVAEGKDEPIGLGGNYYNLDYGRRLVSRGYVVAAPDSPFAGERYNPVRDVPYGTASKDGPGWSLIGQRALDHRRVMDYLASLPFVDASRIGVIGHSLGGESAALLTALDPRVATAVISCGFTILRTLPDAAAVFTAPGGTIFPVSWRPVLSAPVATRPALRFDFDDIMALWAPRPVYLAGVTQDIWSNWLQVAQAASRLGDVYQLLSAPSALQVRYSPQPHSFPMWVQNETFDWLDYQLKRR